MLIERASNQASFEFTGKKINVFSYKYREIIYG